MNRFSAEAFLTLAFSLLAVSSAMLIEISNPVTAVFALPVFILYGWTAYISREGFTKSSLASASVLAFLPLGGIVSVFSIAVGLGNILVSVFAGGERFREYYGSTKIPLLVMGLVFGVFVFHTAVSSPQVSDNIRNSTATLVGGQAEQIVNESNIIGSQTDKQRAVVENTANLTLVYAEGYVLNETRSDLDFSQQTAVSNAFDSAENDLNDELAERTSNMSEEPPVDISERVGDVVRSRLSDEKLAVLIPVIFFATIGLQPLVGLVTAVSARTFEVADRKLGSSY